MTYDDGGNAESIHHLLEVYRAYGAKTTFFVMGEWIQANPDLARQIVAEGHTLGCHGWEHVPYQSLGYAEADRQLKLFVDTVNDVIPGYRVKYIRFPYGDRNKSLTQLAAQYGMQSVMWSLETSGHDSSTYGTVVGGAGNGYIVLSHSLRQFDVYQAEDILRDMMAQGYTFETIDTGIDPKDKFGK